MSAEPQAHPQSAEWARIIYSGIETGSLGPHTIDSGAVYISTHDSRMIANSTINVEKFEVNNYGGDARGGHSERQQIVKWLVDTDDNIKQQTSIFSKAWQSREGEPESGSWLLANQEFQAWLAGNIQALWLHGGGMSISNLIQYLLTANCYSGMRQDSALDFGCQEFADRLRERARPPSVLLSLFLPICSWSGIFVHAKNDPGADNVVLIDDP